jgi:hypothetical protein
LARQMLLHSRTQLKNNYYSEQNARSPAYRQAGLLTFFCVKAKESTDI